MCLQKLHLAPFHKREEQVKWTVAEIIDLASITQDPDNLSKPPLIIYSLGRMTALSTDLGGWLQVELCISHTGVSEKIVHEKKWLAKYDLSWNFPECVAKGKAACIIRMSSQARISQWLQEFQADIREGLEGEEPKALELSALMLEVCLFNLLSSFIALLVCFTHAQILID